jgi:hypothetical protein
MSKKKYKFTVTSFADLAKAYPHAVTEKIIPEQREQKADYAYIAKLLDCKITVPGISIVTDVPDLTPPSDSDTEQATSPEDKPKGEPPAFLKHTKEKLAQG